MKTALLFLQIISNRPFQIALKEVGFYLVFWNKWKTNGLCKGYPYYVQSFKSKLPDL